MNNKKTLKQSLVDRMIAEGNKGIRYTDVVTLIMKIRTGDENFKYDWKKHRGVSGTNLSTSNFGGIGGGYLVNGGGTCGLYTENKKWYAKYYTQEDLDRREKFLDNRKERIRRRNESKYPALQALRMNQYVN